MKNSDILLSIKEKAKKWLTGNYDEETKKQVQFLLKNDENELIDAFYKDLEFGTGGLRGVMGAGTNRMNIYTLGMATQGLSNYLLKQFPNLNKISVAIAYDCRNNSKLFAQTTANIFAANGISVYLFDSLRPTPELSFAIRHFNCQSGIVITASHNPKEYNGYKVYWEDGGQIIAPHDVNIINEVKNISDINDVKFNPNSSQKENITIIGKDVDNIYLNKIKELSLSPEIIKKHNDLKIVYTPIHGTGVKLVPAILKRFGFKNIFNVPEQDINDGNFPTVKSPNPEEAEALNMAINKAYEVDADIVMATDPDGDRVGIAVKDNNNKFVLLNGNQTGALLFNYIISQWNDRNKLTGNEYMVKTIVTSELLTKIANKYDLKYFDVLTGFKYIANIIKLNPDKTFICGGEESYGYLAGDFVRDKDAVMACALIAEAATYAVEQGKTVYQTLIDIYKEFGFYKEKLTYIVKKGKTGAAEIQEIMNNFRNSSPKSINNSKVILVKDYLSQKETNILSSKQSDIELPKSNVLQFFLEDGSKISVRPSGTEPKIKFYISVNQKLNSINEFEKTNEILDEKIQDISKALNII
ncbi:MAG: phospho-sugar mutase [Bacteroidetes bacterium]|nr:MAG: phospho-sugar mutase [Bacteroidota bacterium]